MKLPDLNMKLFHAILMNAAGGIAGEFFHAGTFVICFAAGLPHSARMTE